MGPILIAMLLAAIAAMAITYFMAREFKEPLVRGQFIALAVIPLFFVGVISPIAYNVGLSAAQTGAVSGFGQFLNGSILEADSETFNCDRSKSFNSCEHTYRCDSYTVTVQDPDYVDDNGKRHSRSHKETRWHQCPYATQEFSYTLTDSMGEKHTIASHVLAATPVAWKNTHTLWGKTEAIPSNITRGVPAQWQHAADGIANGNLDPVTIPNTYKNYVLPSERTLLKAYSGDIDALKDKNLLPAHTVNLEDPIRDNFIADKVNFVGVSLHPTTMAGWQDQLMRFNAALGMTKQGDLHIVVVKAAAVASATSPDNYLNAIKAHWLNDFGKKALAKNGIILVLAVNDSATTIEWSRASTGMPVGNGAMTAALNMELNGTPFSAASVLGSTTAQVATVDGKVTAKYSVGKGIVPTITMQKFPFERACMGCTDDDEAAMDGFTQLSTELPLRGAALVWTIIIAVVAGLVIILGLYNFIGVANWNLNDSPSKRNKSSRSDDRYDSYRECEQNSYSSRPTANDRPGRLRPSKRKK